MMATMPDSEFDAAAAAVRAGDGAALADLLARHPRLAAAREPGGRTLLHVATDWPGHFPDVRRIISLLVTAGADVNARFDGEHQERPLHWAASTDDVDALGALLDAGADIDAAGAVIGGGTALNDATAFGQWQAARLLVERGAALSTWDIAALGKTEQLESLLATVAASELNELLWAACHGGHQQTAELLLERGADARWVGWDGLTAGGAAARSGAVELAAWLRTIAG